MYIHKITCSKNPVLATGPLAGAGRTATIGQALIISLIAALLVSGRAAASSSLGVGVPERFQFQPGVDAPELQIESAWWQSFQDPALDTLVAAAIDTNRDLQAALARVDLARSGVMAATATLLPVVSAIGQARIDSTDYVAAVRQQLPDIRARQVGATASWEIDLFGAARAGRRVAQAQVLAAVQARRGALLMVVSETALQYFGYRGALERRRIVAQLVGTERDTLHLTELRRVRQTASDFDVERARADLADTEAALPPLDSLIAATKFRLTTLTGRVPGVWDELLALPLPGTSHPLEAPRSQPADLLRRRPDIMGAEANLMAAEHGQTQARAYRYPQLFVSALLGSQWTSINAIEIGRARFANVAGALTVPLFAGGHIRAGIHAADAREAEALALYEQLILRALEDTETALSVLHDDAIRADALARSVQSRESALSKAQLLYQAGQSDLLQLLDVQRGLLTVRLALATNTTDRLSDSVQLYRALGGGWQALEPAASVSRAMADTQDAAKLVARRGAP